MVTYQIAVILFLIGFILSVLIIGSVESVIKKRKAKKQAIAELEKENKALRNELYALKFRAKLKGVDLDV